MEKKRNAYRLLVGKPKRKTPLERSLWRWMDNNNIDLREREREDDVVWTGFVSLTIGTRGGLL
jgi:hypothetical protein